MNEIFVDHHGLRADAARHRAGADALDRLDLQIHHELTDIPPVTEFLRLVDKFGELVADLAELFRVDAANLESLGNILLGVDRDVAMLPAADGAMRAR